MAPIWNIITTPYSDNILCLIVGGFMRLAATQYSLFQQSYEFYFSGCKGFDGHCKNCHNPELFDFNLGEEVSSATFETIGQKVAKFDSLIKRFFILGGEPLDQELSELVSFITELKKYNKEIWLFTHYDFNQVPSVLKELCDYIKVGPYVEGLPKTTMYNIELASNNQRILRKGEHY